MGFNVEFSLEPIKCLIASTHCPEIFYTKDIRYLKKDFETNLARNIQGGEGKTKVSYVRYCSLIAESNISDKG